MPIANFGLKYILARIFDSYWQSIVILSARIVGLA